jgi:uncharacterized membrane protein YphA (DoxX/SURF4 family)
VGFTLPRADDAVPQWAFVIPRIYVGAVFAAAGFGQLTHSPEWMNPGQSWAAVLHGQITEWLPQSAAWYRPLEINIALPHADLLAPMLAWLHPEVGLGLIAGI